MTRTVLFFRRFQQLTGGHLKVWDFFQHTLASSEHTARIVFSADSVWNEDNPWHSSRRFVVASRRDVRPDVLFLGAFDWENLTRRERDHSRIPVLNFIAHVRHGSRDDPRNALLRHRAIRICVSDEVAEAIRAGGPPNGPVVVIPNGVNVVDAPSPGPRDVDLLVVAVKQPAVGRAVARRLERHRRTIDLVDVMLPRREFLRRLSRARIAVFLPHTMEGFYLPALEAMALGTLAVCPDVVGNRQYCEDGRNSFFPAYSEEAVVAATERALAMGHAGCAAMIAQGQETAARHSLDTERRVFIELLRSAPQLW